MFKLFTYNSFALSLRPMAPIVFIASLFASGCLMTSKETFILPDGFTGHVIVLFGERDGEIGPTYHVPSDGILKVKEAPHSRGSETEYRYQRRDGTLEIITYLDHWGDGMSLQNVSTEEASTKVFAFNDGGVGNFSVHGRIVKYRTFFIGYPKDKARMYDAMVDHVFKLRTALSQDGIPQE